MFSNYGVMLKDSTEGGGHGAVLKEAFTRLVSAQSRMVEIYKEWQSNVKETKDLFNGLSQILSKDSAITNEYFGINSYFMGVDESKNSKQISNFDQFILTFENSIQMGNQLCVLILELLNDCQ